MTRKVGIITFHASYNYGSMLQTYSLQHMIEDLGYTCEIINFRTERQREMYSLPWQRGGSMGRLKRGLMYLPVMRQLRHKQELFETYIHDEYNLSRVEYHTLEELHTADFDYDCYVSGSDQIWNAICRDFDMAYYLPFVQDGRRIAYAPSLGPTPSLPKDDKMRETTKIALTEYDCISVREADSARVIRELTGKDVPVVLDPTLLLDSDEWLDMAGNVPIVTGDYIFLYSPWPEAKAWQHAKKLAKWSKMKVVVSNIYNSSHDNIYLLDSKFRLHLETGPKEFLNLCRHAKYVMGQSFHLAVFCIHMRKPFVIIDGADDSRMANLLSLTGLMSRSIGHNDDITMKFQDSSIDFDYAHQTLKAERARSLKWLADSLSCH